ncbi:hypothetical protein [Amycolatopsis pithecellobii]|uniref:DUF2029 domain-containing protein n=1 Tax=Amycolatopsis pithecellobii TaxID=664692 RepID=A0A6N7ZCL9_9PSEU|nr:hypothetical protein [Amycolatopsis pithecellobii]MTD59541.1 hypothetical protein [Amycolatopsis pithecellobii]
MRTSWWLPLSGALLSALAFLVAKDSLTDDAYISIDYARNLAVHGEWALVHGMPANTATSPLNVLLLGFVTFLTRISGAAHPVLALGIINVGLGATIGWAFSRMRLHPGAALAGTALIVLNSLLLSALGMEVLLTATVLVLLVSFADRPIVFGIVAALAILTRLDLIVFVVLIALCAAEIRRHAVRALGWCVLVVLPWFVFSWFYFGSAVPDTLVIKQLQKSFDGNTYAQIGFQQMWGGDPMAMLTFAPAELGVVAVVVSLVVRRRVDPFIGLGLGGIAYFVVYSLLQVPPYHWYYVPPIVALSAAAVGVGLPRIPQAVIVVLAGLLVIGYAPAFVQRPVPWAAPPFFGNWSSARDYARVGQELAQRIPPGSTVESPGEIGTIAYFCDCELIDGFSDQGLLGPQIRQRIDEAGPVMAWFFRIDYRNFDWAKQPVPLDYRLRYEAGPGPWQVYSVAKGVGHFILEPIR